MKRSYLAVACVIAFYASVGLAGQVAISSLPAQGPVTLYGTIARIKNDRAFTLSDNTGKITVNLAPAISAVLKEGDSVVVSGVVDTGFFGDKSIAASKVEVSRDIGSAIADKVTEITGLSLDQAKTVQISRLPKEGMVKLTGTVDAVKSDKSFTLRDATGTVSVTIQSDEKAALAKGSEVNVIGYVDNGLLGKTINATHVTVTADAAAKTGLSDTR